MQTGYGRLRTPVQPVGIQHANWLWQATYTCTTCRDTACNWLWQATYTCTTCGNMACRLVMAGYVHLYNLWEYSMQTGYGRLRTPVQPVGIRHATGYGRLRTPVQPVRIQHATGYGRLRTPVQPVGIRHADWLWQATYTCTTCRDIACRLVMAGYVHLYNL